MTHPMKFAEDYLDFDEDEAQTELESSYPLKPDWYEPPEITPYRYYNPHAHLLHCSFLTPAEWDRVKARLTPADLANIESGGVVQVGAKAKVWKPEARK